ncbi:hypothetical protein L3Q82_013008 [Scortum barcoo]|uniref:Uncharacterized protein n=1 Tax=Scortum barcoo TaxID=214431 RepID=A0ACB8VZB7_9TELE|nr:hypothetical protein L3Q82_013008 [Scortum barcoo]
MKEAYEIASTTAQKEAAKGKRYYDQKVYGAQLHPGNRVLLRNLKERGGPGKLCSHWEDAVYVVVSQKNPDMPVYEIKPENGGKSRTVHRNLLLPCDSLPVVKLEGKEQGKRKRNLRQNRKEAQLLQQGTDVDSGDEAGGGAWEKKESAYLQDVGEERLELQRTQDHPNQQEQQAEYTSDEEEQRRLSGDSDGEQGSSTQVLNSHPQRERRRPRMLTYDALGQPTSKPDMACYSTLVLLFCVKNQSEKTYVYMSTLKTWTDASDYCREHFTDLPVIENTAENIAVYSAKSATASIWIGLYRVSWTWSDNTQSSFRFWTSDNPNNGGGQQFCTLENPLHQWNDATCSDKFPFICHQGEKLLDFINKTCTVYVSLFCDCMFIVLFSFKTEDRGEVKSDMACYTTLVLLFCVTSQSEKTYVFISTLKTCTDARDYCRENFTDLPVIENTAENTEVYSAKSANAIVWIGLYRV